MTSPSKELEFLMAKVLLGGISSKSNTTFGSALQTSHIDFIVELHIYIKPPLLLDNDK